MSADYARTFSSEVARPGRRGDRDRQSSHRLGKLSDFRFESLAVASHPLQPITDFYFIAASVPLKSSRIHDDGGNVTATRFSCTDRGIRIAMQRTLYK